MNRELLLKKVQRVCSIRKDIFSDIEEEGEGYYLIFPFQDGTTTLRVVLDDISGAELAITSIIILPWSEKGKGHGTSAVESLLHCADKSGVSDIRVMKVSTEENESFWKKNSFWPIGNATNDFKFDKNKSMRKTTRA